MQNKTICIINQYASTPDTGMGGRQYYFAKELAKKGYTVYLIMASFHHLLKEPISVNKKYTEFTKDGINIILIKVGRYEGAHNLKRILNWILFSFRLLGLKKKLQYKPQTVLVSVPSAFSFLGALILAKKFKAKLITDIRDLWPLTLTELGGHSTKHPFIKLLQWIEDKSCNLSDWIISNWPYAYKHLYERGLEKGHFTWIPNGFSIDEFMNKEPLPKEVVARIPDEKFVVGYTGTIGQANAIDVLLNTAENLKENKKVVFLIAGKGKDINYLHQEISARKLNNIIYLGQLKKTQIPTLLDCVDVCYVGFKKNSLYRFGSSLNKLAEYFASKKPIVFSIDSPFKPVSDANAGVTVPAEAPDLIAAAILDLQSMPVEQRNTLGSNGYNYALEHYEYKKLTDKLINVIDNA